MSGGKTCRFIVTSSQHASIERCRELLGDEAVGLSEEHIATIRDHADAMARLVVGLFLEQQLMKEKDDDTSAIR